MTQQERTWLLGNFPNLMVERHRKTSDATEKYNCIAWAADENDRKWWPGKHYHPFVYWPQGAAKVATPEAFIQAFRTRGYEPCDDGRLEPGFEKVVIYTLHGSVTHMARQKASGVWTSKLGDGMDIDHATPQGVESVDYGRVKQFMRRPYLEEVQDG